MADYVPNTDDALLVWLTNLKTKLPTYTATLGITLYSRKQGEPAWKFLSRDTNSPYDDHTPLTTPGTPEVREYQAFGMWGDEQIGQPSDIVSATFAG